MSARNESEAREGEGYHCVQNALDKPHSPAPLPPPINLRIVKNLEYPNDPGRLEYLLYGKWFPVPIIYEDR